MARELAPAEYGADAGARLAGLERAMAAEPAGAAGLLALDWANGNRCGALLEHVVGTWRTGDLQPRAIYIKCSNTSNAQMQRNIKCSCVSNAAVY